MSSFTSTTPISQDYSLLHFHSRRLLLHMPLHQSQLAANPPATGNHHDPLHHYAGTFDANVTIVLSLLLCGIICSIGGNFIVRCACRSRNSANSISNNPSSAQKTNIGIEKKVLKMFTTFKYSAGIKSPGLDTECVICLSEFKPGEGIRVLPKCNHGFHTWCIDKWLGSHSSCPVCRNCLIGTCQKIVNCSPTAPSLEPREMILTTTSLEPEALVCNRISGLDR